MTTRKKNKAGNENRNCEGTGDAILNKMAIEDLPRICHLSVKT